MDELILKPKFIALDTSHWQALIKDGLSGNKLRRVKSYKFLDSLMRKSAIPLISFHHIQELMALDDDELVARRLSFISGLKSIAWFKGNMDESLPATIVDILTAEIREKVNKPKATASEIRSVIASKIIKFGTGEEAMSGVIPYQNELRSHITDRTIRNREVEAISRSKFIDYSNTKISDWLNQDLRSPEDSAQRMVNMQRLLSYDIKTRGDKRITENSNIISHAFFKDVVSSTNHFEGGSSPTMNYLHNMDVDENDIRDNTTLGDVGELAVFRKKLRLINEELGLEWNYLKSVVNMDSLPSQVINIALQKYGQDLKERKGSDMIDRVMVSFSPYADITYVDKRTLENVRRTISKSVAARELIGEIKKAPTYDAISL